MTDDPTPIPAQTAEHERALLAVVLLDPNNERCRTTLAATKPHWFQDSDRGETWAQTRRVMETDPPPPAGPERVKAVLAESAGGAYGLSFADLADVTQAAPGSHTADYYAARVFEAYLRRAALRGWLQPDDDAERERIANLPAADLIAERLDYFRMLGDLLPSAGRSLAVSAADYADAPQPVPILWRDDLEASPDSTDVDAVLSVGECAILASAGGLGKSTWTLEVASAAVTAAELGADCGAACGLRVAAGSVLLVSFEDAPARIAHRLAWMNGGAVPAVHIVPDPAPLWMAAADLGGESHAGPQWDALWRTVRTIGVRLLVIDPVSAALADVSTSETGPVRAFLRALTREAAPADGWPGCGVLLIAHDTKTARDAAAKGEDPGAGIVAGSAAWYDGARGVLSLARDPRSDDRLLQCVKANYGRTGWGARLIERTDTGGAFRGLTLGARMTRHDLSEAKTAARAAKEHREARRGTDGPRSADDGDSLDVF
ncbi:MAG: AAA family ATPase [Spirochaetaceae bacterium]|nr:AAA family ATPase [Spirochaetaceae bacterium]